MTFSDLDLSMQVVNFFFLFFFRFDAFYYREMLCGLLCRLAIDSRKANALKLNADRSSKAKCDAAQPCCGLCRLAIESVSSVCISTASGAELMQLSNAANVSYVTPCSREMQS